VFASAELGAQYNEFDYVPPAFAILRRGGHGGGYRISSLSIDYLVLRNKLRKHFTSRIFRASRWMANQERSAHVSYTKHNAHWRGGRPLF
jgi:hypothetical protein